VKKIKINEKNFLKIPNKKEIWLEIKSKKKYIVKDKLKIKENYFLMLSFPKENKNERIVNIIEPESGIFKNFLIRDFLKNFIFLG
jgi:hypothetical protein